MIAYVDSSVLLRIALGQNNALREWGQIERGVSSTLISTECLRTLDRVRLRAKLSDIEIARLRATLLALIGSLELVEVDTIILDRAAQPFGLGVGHPPQSHQDKRGVVNIRKVIILKFESPSARFGVVIFHLPIPAAQNLFLE